MEVSEHASRSGPIRFFVFALFLVGEMAISFIGGLIIRNPWLPNYLVDRISGRAPQVATEKVKLPPHPSTATEYLNLMNYDEKTLPPRVLVHRWHQFWYWLHTNDVIRPYSGVVEQRGAGSLAGRGSLEAGYYADIVVFDPNTIADRATYAKPHQLATGVEDVLVNGDFAFKDGKATGASTGRVVHGRAWLGAPGGGCRAAASDWAWNK